jgi:hypothetical protein
LCSREPSSREIWSNPSGSFWYGRWQWSSGGPCGGDARKRSPFAAPGRPRLDRANRDGLNIDARAGDLVLETAGRPVAKCAPQNWPTSMERPASDQAAPPVAPSSPYLPLQGFFLSSSSAQPARSWPGEIGTASVAGVSLRCQTFQFGLLGIGACTANTPL